MLYSSSWRWQSTSAYTDWRRRTWRTTAWQSLPLPASNICGPLALGYCPYQGQGPRWRWGVSRSQVQLSGTVCQPPCEPQLSPPWRSLDIWRLTCSADWQRARGLFRTRSTNLLIIIIIILKIFDDDVSGGNLSSFLYAIQIKIIYMAKVGTKVHKTPKLLKS